ncbi:hypothetical protein D3C87_1732370 [compost metagenome]
MNISSRSPCRVGSVSSSLSFSSFRISSWSADKGRLDKSTRLSWSSTSTCPPLKPDIPSMACWKRPASAITTTVPASRPLKSFARWVIYAMVLRVLDESVRGNSKNRFPGV